MKYQSELIKEIVDTRGHEKSSLHYESECIETWIEENKGAYPKLTDYQAEWLNYIVQNPIGEFPYLALTDVTNATVDNVVPLAYQSAILKGQTLVNLNASESAKISPINVCDFTMVYLKPNTTYTIIFEVSYSGTESNGTLGFLTTDKANWNVNVPYDGNGSYKKLLTTNSNIDLGITLRFRRNNVDGDFTISNVIVLEGDYTNQDISYFEGMQSVKMPVLTTTGKNLFGICEFEKGNMEGYPSTDVTITNNSVSLGKAGASVTIKLKGKPNTKYTISFTKNNTSTMNLREWGNRTNTSDVNGEVEWNYGTYNPNNNNGLYKLENIQIEESSVATACEPYKSNILTVNEDVTLRGIGEVKDELDLLTGELTHRIGEVVLDGSEDWQIDSDTNDYRLALSLKHNGEMVKYSQSICDRYPTKTSKQSDTTYNYVYIGSRSINLYENPSMTLEEFKSKLKQNPMTFQYQFTTESIKTVDLSIQDQDGNTLRKIKPIEGTMHIHSDGTPLKPTITMEIPVEAITQNLASFIGEE